MKNGGFGATSSNSIASAASYSALADFARWAEKHSDLKLVEWLQDHVQANPELGSVYLNNRLNEAMAELERDWSIKAKDITGEPLVDNPEEQDLDAPIMLPITKCLLLAGTKRTSQAYITKHVQKTLWNHMVNELDQDGQQRLVAVSNQTSPLADSASQIIPFSTEKAWLVQSPMGHLSLSSSIELSNEAFVTVSSIHLGVPVPHMVIINQAIANKNMDLWGDQAFNKSAWAGLSRKSTHDRIVQVLAGCMSWAGFPTYANEKKVPTLPVPPGENPTRKLGDLCTSTGGLIDQHTDLGFYRHTQLVADIKMVHVYTTQGHTYKPSNIKTAEQEKRAKYRMYSTAGLAFAPAVINTFGQLGPDLLRIGWKCATKAAHRDLPNIALASLQDQGTEMEAFKARRGKHYHECRQRLLEVVYEGVAEQLYGISHTLCSNVQYQQWMNHSRPEWMPIFNDLPPLNGFDLQDAAPGGPWGGPALVQGPDLDSAAAAAAADFLCSLAVSGSLE